MPNVKLWIDGKTYAFMVGTDGVKNIFATEKNTVIVLGEDGITEYSGFPFVLEREYSKKDKEK